MVVRAGWGGGVGVGWGGVGWGGGEAHRPLRGKSVITKGDRVSSGLLTYRWLKNQENRFSIRVRCDL